MAAVYGPTWESVRTHRVPDWYEDAKLGVFVHWGLYSVPGWAPQVPDIQQLLKERGPRRMLRDNPYAEWYLNSMQIPDSPTQRHHRDVYGDRFPYDGFVGAFDDASAGARLDALAELCRDAGARYVVLTAKHSDGFALWPSGIAHPVKGSYHARRDLVGDLADAVRAEGMRMGLYYSGGYDWPYNRALLRGAADLVLAAPYGPAYRDYVTAHVTELIERYRPSVLWNDISWPRGGNLAALFADYYNTVDDGVVNDRWLEPALPRNPATHALVRLAGELVERCWRFLPEERKRLTFAPPTHCDFRTPEYEVPAEVPEHKWELVRGVGHSFGANRAERPEDMLGAAELVQLLCEVVSKNGNLLIGIGPRPDGTVSEAQAAPLRGLGAWLAANGEAISGSRPWDVAASTTAEGGIVRFTRRGDRVYALLVAADAGARCVILDAVEGASVRGVRLVAVARRELLECAVSERDGGLAVHLPERLPSSPVTALDLGPGVRARTG